MLHQTQVLHRVFILHQTLATEMHIMRDDHSRSIRLGAMQ